MGCTDLNRGGPLGNGLADGGMNMAVCVDCLTKAIGGKSGDGYVNQLPDQDAGNGEV
jgi:hypothetical protein